MTLLTTLLSLPPSTYLLLLLLLPPLLYLLLTPHTTKNNPLSRFPGPLIARYTYLYIFHHMWSAPLDTFLLGLHATYGPVVRIGPNDILLGDADEIIRTNSLRSTWTRSDWFKNMDFDFENYSVVTLPGVEEHDRRKAKLLRSYEGRGTADLEGVIDGQLEILVDLLRKKARGDEKGVVDWAQVARWFGMDVATVAVTGEAWGDLREERDKFGFFEIGGRLVPFMHCVAMWAGLRRVTSSKWFMRNLGPKVTDEKGLGKFMGWVKANVERRGSEDGAQGDMLADWLKGGLSRRDAETEGVTAVIAAADTAAAPLRSIMLHIATSPSAYNKLKAELAESIRDKRISSTITYAEAQKLPYLQAVLHEGMRILPVTMTGFGKRVGPEGDTLCGIPVPPETEVYPNNQALMYSKDVFGEDVNVFRPERWIEADAERRVVMRNYVDILFSKGRWQCPGKIMAWMEMNKVFVEVLRQFDVQVVNPGRPWKMRAYSTVVIEDFEVKFTEARLG
ncbi:putative cytochrome P450 E-class, group I [Podospora aff. communis PSN243]|uniref:Cytochrome P450 E-class, group I n=1 Tax=Podospora aff. communis PSN243 TaxID=3040156 RepID=A0AAV9GDF3_9PEZI|nr:putative cytochrome P450 E-class, group I [Podospora aff. communis PSN243]